MNASTPVVAPMPMWVVQEGRPRGSCTLTFDPGQPLVVKAAFGNAVWEFSRDLLVGAIDSWQSPVGLGDIRAWTTLHFTKMLRIELRPPDGTCVIDLPWRSVQRFLGDSYVSMVDERQWLDATASNEELAKVVGKWADKLQIGPRCPRCRATDCLNVDHVATREAIRDAQVRDRNEDVTGG